MQKHLAKFIVGPYVLGGGRRGKCSNGYSIGLYENKWKDVEYSRNNYIECSRET